MPLPVMPPSVTPAMIAAAHARIQGKIRHTPLLKPGAGAFGSAADITFKLEFLQHSGSFKARGAFNNLLSRQAPAVGVAAASGGNHGAAVAFAAHELGQKARIFVPEISSAAKIAKIRAYGAEIVIGGATYYEALAACEAYIAASGALSIHAFSTLETVAGQGTAAVEWEADGGVPDTVLVAVGGGGLISGIASYWNNRVKVVGVEPEGSCALHAALAQGGPVDVGVDSIAADSLGARNVGAFVYEIAKRAVSEVVLVPDRAIIDAQARLWREFCIAAEPGGATALAALLCGAYRPEKGERVGVLLCGGNVDLDKLAKII